MGKKLFLLVLSCSIFLLQGMDKKKNKKNMPSISINLNNNMAAVAKATASQMQQASQSFPLAKNIAQATYSFKETLKSYRWYIVGVSFVATYITCIGIMARGYYYIQNKNLWSNWYPGLSLEQFLSIPQDQLSAELLNEIQRRYTNSSTLEHIIKPFALFMNDIEQEELCLQWYENFYSLLGYTRVTKILPGRFNSSTEYKNKSARLAYLKNIFQSWVMHYKLEQLSKIRANVT